MDSLLSIFLGFLIVFTFITFSVLSSTKKAGKATMKTWIKSVVISFFVLIFLVYILWLIISQWPNNYRKSDFDSNRWAANKEERFRMIDHLIESDTLKKMSREEILNLLGKPESDSIYLQSKSTGMSNYIDFPDTTKTGVDLIYFIGTQPGDLKSPEFLFIWLENDSFSECKIRGHYQ